LEAAASRKERLDSSELPEDELGDVFQE